MILDLLGHAAYVLLMLGTILVAKVPRCRRGWALRMSGTATWMGIGVAMAMSSIYLWSLVFLAIDAFGLKKAERW